MSSNPLPLSIIADVTVVTTSPQVSAPMYNTGLVIGQSTVIDATERVRKYLQGNWSASMLNDGFANTDPEYICAQLYFGQPQPSGALYIGVQAGAESALEAFTACRIANAEWYPGMVIGAAAADHIACAEYAQSQVGTVYFGTTDDADVLAGTDGNVLKTIFAANSSRTWMQYATTNGDLNPNQIYFVAAVMGRAMGSNTQLAGSAFTMKFSAGQPLSGVYTEPLNTTEISHIEGIAPGEGPNGNLFLNYANKFNILEQGTMMANLTFFDQILNLDVLAAKIQYNVINRLVSLPKVPQTDAGQQVLVQAVEQALDGAVLIGFVSGGTWQGQTIDLGLGQKLTTGTALPNGYMVLTQKYSQMSQADIQARKAPPIYVALIEAGAVHFVTIAVIVQA